MKEIYLEFERPVEEIDKSMADLSTGEKNRDGSDFSIELKELEKKRRQMLNTIYQNLTPWQVTQVARHPNRPLFSDYRRLLFDDFMEFHGDRLFMDDHAIVTGLGSFDGEKFVVIGEDKGKDTKEKIMRNFGMPQPEGYRKSQRAMDIAEKFKLPILTFIDTAGAYPGKEGEERGQGEAIARSLYVMSAVKVPIVALVIGEGGSGGALAIAVADRVLMLKNSIYSVISPESCASILWRDSTKAEQAALALRVDSDNLQRLNIIEEVIPEPVGGAHRDYQTTIASVKEVVMRHYRELKKMSPHRLVEKRYERFRKLGEFETIK